jgi:hypothetical protein
MEDRLRPGGEDDNENMLLRRVWVGTVDKEFISNFPWSA